MQSDLIRIGSDRVKAIRAHDLHQALGVKSRLTTWIDREIEKHDLVDGVDYVDAVARRTDAGRRDAWFTIATASRIASSTERATKVAVIHAIDDIARAPAAVDDASAAVNDDASPMDGWSPPKVTTEIVDGVERSTVDLRDLYRSLRVRTSYDLWSGRRLEEFGFIEGREVHSILNRPTGGISTVTKRVTIRAANQLAMVEKSAIGRRVREYFLDCEERLRSLTADAAAAESARLQADMKILADRIDNHDRHNRGGASNEPHPADVDPRPVERDRIATLNRLLDMPNMTASILETVSIAFNIRSLSIKAPTDQTDEGTTGPKAGPDAGPPVRDQRRHRH